jgi:hypothetical protein
MLVATCGPSRIDGHQKTLAAILRSLTKVFLRESTVHCECCNSGSVRNFTAQIAIRGTGIEDTDRLPVFAFPYFILCLDCGFAQIQLPGDELLLFDRR